MAKNKRAPEAIAADLFPALEHFGNLFKADGELQTKFNAVQNLLLEMQRACPRFQTKLGVAEPFGAEIKSEMLRYLISMIGGRWYVHSTLEDIVVYLFGQSSIQACPTNRDK